MHDKVLKQQKSSEKTVKSGKKTAGHHITEHYELMDGAVQILRTNRSGNFWQMSCWVREEGKCFRKSLRTKNKEEAMELAREEFFKIQGNIRSGNRIFSITARELVDSFIKHKDNEAKSGLITEGRVLTIKTSLNRWFLNYVGETKKVDEIKRDDFYGYYVWRRKKASDVRNATLINERALVHSLFSYGIRNGYLNHGQLPNFERLSIKKSQVDRRDALEVDEWEKMYRSFRRWVSKAEHEKEKEQAWRI